jgi:hypothetical protein
MNRGDPITGIESWFARDAGIAMKVPEVKICADHTGAFACGNAVRTSQTLDVTLAGCLVAADHY